MNFGTIIHWYKNLLIKMKKNLLIKMKKNLTKYQLEYKWFSSWYLKEMGINKKFIKNQIFYKICSK